MAHIFMSCPTTTTTTTIAYDYYLANKYDCATCSLQDTGVAVCLPAGTTPNYSQFYNPPGDTTYSYKLVSTNTTTISLVLDTPHYASCPGCA